MAGVVAEVKEVTEEETQRLIRVANKPPIDECLSLYDFEVSLLLPPSAGRHPAKTDHFLRPSLNQFSRPPPGPTTLPEPTTRSPCARTDRRTSESGSVPESSEMSPTSITPPRFSVTLYAVAQITVYRLLTLFPTDCSS